MSSLHARATSAFHFILLILISSPPSPPSPTDFGFPSVLLASAQGTEGYNASYSPSIPADVGKWEWQPTDNFDGYIQEFNSINPWNCQSNRGYRMQLDTISQQPRFNTMLEVNILYNRTRLWHLHNQALRRAFFVSFMLQWLNASEVDFPLLPGMQYYYLSSVADVSANQDVINGSSVYFDNNCMYANWYKTLLFNTTLNLFSPRAYREDDYFEPYNWLREPSNMTLNVLDMGAGPNSNYTSTTYMQNPYYFDQSASINYLPDYEPTSVQLQSGSSTKFQYVAQIKWGSDKTGIFKSNTFESTQFFGPPYSGQKDPYLPVRFTPPYFDCGYQDRWIFSTVAPVVDFMPRYSPFNHIRRARFVAVSVMDTELYRLEINPCPTMPGNPGPNRFAGTARCKQTTNCEPLPRWNLWHRGGYQCMCKNGYRYPFWEQGPFQGIDIEQADEDEYNKGFNCIKIGWKQQWPFKNDINLQPMSSTGVSGRKKRDVSDDPFGNQSIAEELDSKEEEMPAPQDSLWQYTKRFFVYIVATFSGKPKEEIKVSMDEIVRALNPPHASRHEFDEAEALGAPQRVSRPRPENTVFSDILNNRAASQTNYTQKLLEDMSLRLDIPRNFASIDLPESGESVDSTNLGKSREKFSQKPSRSQDSVSLTDSSSKARKLLEELSENSLFEPLTETSKVSDNEKLIDKAVQPPKRASLAQISQALELGEQAIKAAQSYSEIKSENAEADSENLKSRMESKAENEATQGLSDLLKASDEGQQEYSFIKPRGSQKYAVKPSKDGVVQMEKPGEGGNASTNRTKDAKKRRYKRDVGYLARYEYFDQSNFWRALDLFNRTNLVTKSNCKSFMPEYLQLPGDVGFGADTQFEFQARSALRIAHFLSAFMQTVEKDETYGTYTGDRPINEFQVFAEVLSNVMGDPRLLASGVFFDLGQFSYSNGTRRDYFGPFAYKLYDNTVNAGTDASAANVQTPTTFYAVDYAGMPIGYANQPWFSTVKERWASDTYGLKRFLVKPFVRVDMAGSQLKRFDHYPLYFRAPTYEDGFWSNPYFDCDLVNSWVITYAVPFFGKSKDVLGSGLEFRGVVTASIQLRWLEISQCPAPFYQPNAFKGTALCDFESQYCAQVGARNWMFGSYKCECRQGYEYPFDDGRSWFFDGPTMQDQYLKMLFTPSTSRYPILKCREAGANAIHGSFLTLALLLIPVLLKHYFDNV